MTNLDEAKRILALRGVDARNEVSKCQSVPVLLHLSRLEREGPNRVLVLDRIPGRLRKLGATETVVPTDPQEFYRLVRESGDRECFCSEIDEADRPCVNHDPVQVQPPGEDVVTCTRCRETTATGEAEIERLFGYRQVPIKGGSKRARQPQCRPCRSKPPAGRKA